MATVNWANPGTDGLASVGTNWDNGTGPGGGDDVVIGGSGTAYTVTLDVASSPAFDSLMLGDPAGNGNVILSIGANTLNVTGSGSGFTDAITLQGSGGSLITVAGGTINATDLNLLSGGVLGSGSLNISGTTSGTGGLTAFNGTLAVSGTISSGVVLTIDNSFATTLAILGTATAASAISIFDANQTLTIGGTASLTIDVAESITNGLIHLGGGSLTLGNSSALTIGSGASLGGTGIVTAASLSGSGTVLADGGTLELSQSLGASTGTNFSIGSSSVLQLDAADGGGNIFTFVNDSGDSGALGLGDDTGFTTDTISGMVVGTSGAQTDFIDIEGHTVSVTNVAGQGTNSATITLSDGAVLNLANLSSTAWFVNTVGDGGLGTDVFVSDTACYRRGTLIRTERGEVLVENIAIGDEVVTFSGEARPVKWVGRRSYGRRFIAGNRVILPIRIDAGALAAGVPVRDLDVSPEHALYVDGMLVPARLLINGLTIRQLEDVDRLEYFHIELETHDVLFAEGAAAETYVDCDNRGMFHNGGEFAQLYPADRPEAWQFCAPRVEPGSAELAAIRADLRARAESLGRVTRDPDLHLIVDGNIVHPQAVAGGAYRFTVPAGAGTLAIASRRAVPAEMGAASGDARVLGVSVERIMLHGGGTRLEIGPESAALCDGFYAEEGAHRWTDGYGVLAPQWLACFAGEFAVEVQIGVTKLQYPAMEARAASTPSVVVTESQPARARRQRSAS